MRRVFIIATALLAVSCQRTPVALDVAIALPASVPAGSFSLTVDYSQAGARPQMDKERPICASILPQGTVSFEDDGRGRLLVSVKSPEALVTPLQVAACRMLPADTATGAAEVMAALRVRLFPGVALETAASTQPGPVAGRASAGGPAEEAAPNGGPLQGTAPPRAAPWPDGSQQPAGEGTRTPPLAARSRPDGASHEGDRSEGVSQAPARASTAPRRSTGSDSMPWQGSPPPVEVPQTGGRETSRAGSAATGLDARQLDDPVNPWSVTVGVTTPVGLVSALQFDVIHRGQSGSFVGRSQSVDCRVLVDVALSTGNNQRQGRLSYALVDLAGFDTPADIVSCTFKTRETVGPDSFDIKVVDATDDRGSALDVEMAVTSVRRLD